MGSRLDRLVPFVRTVVRETRREDVTFMAGSIAYNAFVSLIPLLALLFLVAGVVADEALAAHVLRIVGAALPRSATRLLRNYLVGGAVEGTVGASLIGLVTLVWGTFKIFRSLDTAFSSIYDTEGQNSLVDQFKDGLIVLLALGVGLVAAAVATVIVAAFPRIPLLGVLSPLVLVAGLTLAFFPMYYFFPDVDVTPRRVLPGVIVAAAGWTVLQALFQAYVTVTGGSSAADVLGAIMLLLTWLYLSGLVLLVGAIVNAVLEGYAGEGRRTPATVGGVGATADSR